MVGLGAEPLESSPRVAYAREIRDDAAAYLQVAHAAQGGVSPRDWAGYTRLEREALLAAAQDVLLAIAKAQEAIRCQPTEPALPVANSMDALDEVAAAGDPVILETLRRL